MPDDPAREAAALGAARLDREHRRWAYRVDLQKLDTSSIDGCPLAQVYRGGEPRGAYSRGAWALFGGDSVELARHGFSAIPGVSWPRLDEAWREAIEARTKGGTA